MKTVLAPGAPWYTKKELKGGVIKIDRRTRKITAAEVEANFEKWLNNLDQVKQGVKNGTRRRGF